MAKIQIKSEKLTPFGGIFSMMEQFDSMLSSVNRLHVGVEKQIRKLREAGKIKKCGRFGRSSQYH